MDTHMLSLGLAILGPFGMTALLISACIVLWRYRDSSMGTFRWYVRNQHFKQLSALACFFFLAMTASYVVLLEVWAIFYLVVALKTGTWWLRISLIQRT
jgi:hypothetical protein